MSVCLRWLGKLWLWLSIKVKRGRIGKGKEIYEKEGKMEIEIIATRTGPLTGAGTGTWCLQIRQVSGLLSDVA